MRTFESVQLIYSWSADGIIRKGRLLKLFMGGFPFSLIYQCSNFIQRRFAVSEVGSNFITMELVECLLS